MAGLDVSVVCPTFNSAEYIAATLDSVMRQTLAPRELIISDDGSTDHTVSAVRAWLHDQQAPICARVLCNAHRGPGAARNRGIEAAQGEWIAFIDSDDHWTPRKLELVADTLDSHPAANFVCHAERWIRADGTDTVVEYGRGVSAAVPLSRQLYQRNLFSTSAVVCRRALLIGQGLFDEELMSAQDYDLWLRLSAHINPVFISEPLGAYIERAGNITSGNLLARMLNELRIARRHRAMVSPVVRYVRFGRIGASYARQALQRIGRAATARARSL